MNAQQKNLRIVLLANGIVDLFCAAFLLIVPRTIPQLLGYNPFDVQGSYMAGGWGVSTLALGIIRIYTSPRNEYHPIGRILGLTRLRQFTVMKVSPTLEFAGFFKVFRGKVHSA